MGTASIWIDKFPTKKFPSGHQFLFKWSIIFNSQFSDFQYFPLPSSHSFILLSCWHMEKPEAVGEVPADTSCSTRDSVIKMHN